MRIVIGHLYPALMNLYGDRGNVTVLQQRAAWRSFDVVVTEIHPGETPWWSRFDVVFIGGGQDREQRYVAERLSGPIGRELRRAAEDGLVVLAVCGGFQLLGHSYELGSGETLPGAGVIDAATRSGPRRMVGDVLAVRNGRELVGFENHAGRTWLGTDSEALARVVAGFGNNGEDGTEGAICHNTFGTYLHGPVLPKNPWLADELLTRALDRRYGKVELPVLDDGYELAAAGVAADRARARRRRPNMV